MENKEFEKCIRCNKPLKSKEARRRGYGDHCWKLYQKEISEKRNPLYKLFHKT